jgi:hypothetical protein
MKLSRAVAVSLVAGTVAALAQLGGTAPARPTANVVGAAGDLRVPADYRTLYQAIGSWAIAADGGQGSKEIHAAGGDGRGSTRTSRSGPPPPTTIPIARGATCPPRPLTGFT